MIRSRDDLATITYRSGQVHDLPIVLGEPSVSDRDGLIVPVTVAGGTLATHLTGPDYLSMWPHIEQINGVPYDVSWCMERGNPRLPNADRGGWRMGPFRVQRVDSNVPRDRTSAAELAVSRLMRRITEAIAADRDLMRRAEIVAAERLVRDRDVAFTAALAALAKAERELVQAEESLHALTGGDLALVSDETRLMLGEKVPA